MERNTSRLATRRLFFALWPTAELRERIVNAVREVCDHVQGRAVPRENLHVTLAFLGAVPERRLESLCAIDFWGGMPFEFALDRIEYWPGPGILCLTSRQPPVILSQLVAQLRSKLPADLADTFPQEFRAHVTLKRDVKARIDRQIEPLVWPVSQLVLVQSQQTPRGSEYLILKRWPPDRETV